MARTRDAGRGLTEREGLYRERARIMVWAAGLIGLLVTAFEVYGMIAGDREVLANVWSLVKSSALAVIVWAGGKSVLDLLRTIRTGDEETRRHRR
jgi:hypothetical protein